MKHSQDKRSITIPQIPPVKFIERSNGTLKGYAVNTYHGLAKNYNEDRVSIIMNITKPNYKGRWPRCSYFAVFDGHGGNKCSDFLKENMHKYITQNSHFPHQPIEALKFGFSKAEKQFLSYAESQNPVERSGSCAIVLLIIDQICYIANVGDSRAILSTNQGKNVYSISKDHKPDSDTQKKRIIKAGGNIYRSQIKQKNGQTLWGPYRIDPGKLSVSRSFGDIEAKLQKYDGNPNVLIAKPEITYFEINNSQHDFIILGSDGIYDKLTNDQVAECFWKQQRFFLKSKKVISSKNDYEFIGSTPSKIIEKSMQSHSLDNLTSLVVMFEDNGKSLLPSNRNVQKNSSRNQLRKVSFNENVNTMNINIPQSSQRQERETVGCDRIRSTSNQFMRSVKGNESLTKIMSKRKSTNYLLNGNYQKKQQQNHGSINSSLSTKVLPKYIKGDEKININQINKKKTIDNLKKQKKEKESLWKQLSSLKDRKINHEKNIRS